MKEKKRRTTFQDILAGQQEFVRKYQAQYNGGERFEILSHGFCQWTKVAFVRKDAEFYKLTRTVYAGIKDKDSERKEYFRGKLVRRYLGLQNCFIEFCDFLQTCNAQSMRQKVLLVAQELKLDMATARMYGTFYKKVF
ncbi:MAG: hypothetical protein D4Q79_01140 [Spirochaetia bacterium]|nr:MAG: hypothetical protein D4Q79_01140 [Spirochaetia bacterium]